jgi:hypothetical protein
MGSRPIRHEQENGLLILPLGAENQGAPPGAGDVAGKTRISQTRAIGGAGAPLRNASAPVTASTTAANEKNAIEKWWRSPA